MKPDEFSLGSMDTAVLDRLEADFPADWDMDRLFEKSYRRFLESSGKVDETVGTEEEYTVEVLPKRRIISIFTRERIAVACCAVFASVLAVAVLMHPDREAIPPENIPQPPAVIHETSTTAAITASSTVTETTTSSTESPTTSSAVTTITRITAAVVEPPTSTTELPTEVPTEPSPETTEQTTASTEAETSETTTETTVTDRSDSEYGYFTVANSRFTYIRNSDTEVQEREYSPELEGFSVKHTHKDPYSEGFSLKDEVGEHGYSFQLLIFPYEYFQLGQSWSISYLDDFDFFEINGKPACSLRSDGTAYLFWDDGSSICYTVGSEEHYEYMLTLAQGL